MICFAFAMLFLLHLIYYETPGSWRSWFYFVFLLPNFFHHKIFILFSNHFLIESFFVRYVLWPKVFFFDFWFLRTWLKIRWKELKTCNFLQTFRKIMKLGEFFSCFLHNFKKTTNWNKVTLRYDEKRRRRKSWSSFLKPHQDFCLRKCLRNMFLKFQRLF